MRRAVTTESYAQRIERVVAALHGDPGRRWRLEELADIACFSPWHFHRVYRAICGETPDDTRRRVLLHRAAGELIASSGEIAQIARRAGYRSAAAFTRAFAQAYGRPPAAYRARRADRAPSKIPAERKAFTMNSAPYEIMFSKEPPRRLVGLPHLGDYQGIGQAFERLGALARRIGLDPGAAMIGVYYDDPASVPAARRRSFAALEAEPSVTGEAPLEIRELTGGPAASIVHKGPYVELPGAYDWLYREWLPKSGREPADAPPFEIYLNNPGAVPPSDWLTRIVLPLKA